MSERKVLAVPQQNPEPMPMDMPMDMGMGGDMPMGDTNDPMMGGGMPPMDMGMQQNPYDTNFDAGVEADENADPKKYIQQLTGKLSQSLRNYNDGQPQADADLNKYVAGMIIKQAIDGLSPEDVQEVLGKVKSGEDIQEPQGNEPPMDMQPPMGDPNAQPPMDMGMGGQQPPQMEGRRRMDNRKLMRETMTTMFDNQEDNIQDDKRKSNRQYGYRSKPYVYR